jgi:hypothetical protein
MSTGLIELNKKHLALALTAAGASLAAGTAQSAVIKSDLLELGDGASLLVTGVEFFAFPSNAVTSNGTPLLKLSVEDGSSNASISRNTLSLNDVVGNSTTWNDDAKARQVVISATGYYGLRSDSGQYGWLNIQNLTLKSSTIADPDGDKTVSQLIATYDWAYQDNAGVAIQVGSTEDLTDTSNTGGVAAPGNAVPEPAGLALVAIGLVAAAAARRRPR